MTSRDTPNIIRSRLKLLAIFALFFGPLIFAMIWYYGLDAAYAPSGGTNHAPLVAPVVPLKAFSNPRIDGEGDIDLGALERHWTVIHRLDGPCGPGCETALYNTRQTRLALGKDIKRIRRLLLGDDAALMRQAAREHPDLELVQRVAGGLAEQIGPVLRDQQAAPDDALLVDPLGNVMMLIPASIDPSDLLKDLKKLMKLSKVG
jgi:hypothetical protein